MPDGWAEVPAVTLAACEAKAIRWTGEVQPWGQPVIQVERAVSADHVWMCLVNLIGKEIGDERKITRLVQDGAGAQLNVPDLLALRQVVDDLITSITTEGRESR